MCRFLHKNDVGVFYHEVGDSNIKCIPISIFEQNKELLNRFTKDRMFTKTTLLINKSSNKIIISEELFF